MSKYDLFRRRIAPVAFAAAIVLMARDSCNKQERARATFVLDFGAVARDVRGVDAELWMAGAQVGVFHRAALDGMTIGPVRFDAVVPASDGELRVDVALAGTGAPRHVVKRVHAEEGATVTVRLEPDLLAAPR